MPYVSEQYFREQISVTSAIRQLAANYLLGALPAAEYQRQLRELIARYPRTRSPGARPTAEHRFA